MLAKENKTIEEHTNDVIKRAIKLNRLKYINNIDLLLKACESHDIGKANVEFQNRIKNKTKFDSSKEIGHNILSALMIDKNDFDTEDDYIKVLYSVLFHHNHVNNFEELENKRELAKTLVNVKTNINRRILNKLKNVDIDTEVLAGLLKKCDYSASADIEIEYENDFLVRSVNSLKYNYNELQNYMIENRDKNVIAIAQTGMGKTEAGLLWIGDNKGFFTLPLKTSLNSMYSRIKNMCADDKVALLHSDTFSYSFSETNNITESALYTKECKSLSYSLTLCTIDQIFNFIFLYKGYDLKLATLSYSKIVIDEIQTYSADLLCYIIKSLSKLNKTGCKFAIITATLCPFILDLLRKEGIDIKHKVFTNNLIRHNVKVINKELDINDIVMSKQCKRLVICNTIKKAQYVYDELISKGLNVRLLHSKFNKKHRKSKEEDIVRVGRTEYNEDIIYVSTNLVEASLDIDFDLLFTELSDLNSLFQRFGRVNRKGMKEINEYNCFVYTENNDMFIDRTMYNLSKEALKDVDGRLDENSKIELINKYFTFDNIKNSSFYKEYKKYSEIIDNLSKNELDKSDADRMFRDIISYDIIDLKTYEENIDEINYLIENDNVYNRLRLEDYLITVSKYDIKNTVSRLKLKDREILIVECNYDEERGFSRKELVFDDFCL